MIEKIIKNKAIIIKMLVIALVIIVFVLIYRMSSQRIGDSPEDIQKKKVIDDVFGIWIAIAGPSDKQNLLQNEKAIKDELSQKLSVDELNFLNEYSQNFKKLMDEKSLFSPTSISMMTYLGTNFVKMQTIAEKTSIKDFLDKLGVSVRNAQKAASATNENQNTVAPAY